MSDSPMAHAVVCGTIRILTGRGKGGEEGDSLGQRIPCCVCYELGNAIVFGKGTAMPGGAQPDNGIANGQDTKEEHGQQQR